MRLIDADALTDFLKCLFPARGMWEIEGDTAKDAICETVVEAMEMVKNMETIEPRPRGQWLPDNRNYYEERFVCSVCGRSYKVDTCMGKPMWDFCPCGADMRQREEVQGER